MSKKYVAPATLLCDFYKVSHREQYPEGTQAVYSTWTPRSNKHYPSVTQVIAFGMQGMIKSILIDYFTEAFFKRDKQEVVNEYVRYIKYTLGVEKPEFGHISDLHDLGYLPLEIKTLPEGTRVPMRVPMMTIRNTNPNFFWVTNYIETLVSAECWLPATSATIADRYRRILDKYALETCGDTEFVKFQGHDFSMRGMAGVSGAMLSGAGHLLSFVGTDTVPSIAYHEAYYGANIEKELVGTSIPATEHSVMCAGGVEDEEETYRRLINKIYPNGMVSIVSDTWDLWYVITGILPKLKADIMARDGKVVIRPDSGNPADILCGDPNADVGSSAHKGVIELLWEIFSGTTTEEGYKVLDSHIGSIYGDAITPEVCEEICFRLKHKGFASINVVFGIGSFTYQFNTRDTFGFAMKSTAVVINGAEHMIYKDPLTDDGTKKSNTGAVVVQSKDGVLHCVDGLSIINNVPDLMRIVFIDGRIVKEQTLGEIRERITLTA